MPWGWGVGGGVLRHTTPSLTGLAPSPFLPLCFATNRRGNASCVCCNDRNLCAVRLLSFIAALHKRNIEQVVFQELERNTELFGCSLQTDTRERRRRWRGDLSSQGGGPWGVRLRLFSRTCSEGARCFGKNCRRVHLWEWTISKMQRRACVVLWHALHFHFIKRKRKE